MSPRYRGVFGHATLQMADDAVPRELMAAILERIHRFGVPTLVQRGRRGDRGERGTIGGAEADDGQKRAGIVAPESAGEGLTPRSEQTGVIYGDRLVFDCIE